MCRETNQAVIVTHLQVGMVAFRIGNPCQRVYESHGEIIVDRVFAPKGKISGIGNTA